MNKSMLQKMTKAQIIALVCGEDVAVVTPTPKAKVVTVGDVTVPTDIKPDMNPNQIMARWMRANSIDVNSRWPEAKALLAQDVEMPDIVRALRKGTVPVTPKVATTRKAKGKKATSTTAKVRTIACSSCGARLMTKNPKQVRCSACSKQAQIDFCTSKGIALV